MSLHNTFSMLQSATRVLPRSHLSSSLRHTCVPSSYRLAGRFSTEGALKSTNFSITAPKPLPSPSALSPHPSDSSSPPIVHPAHGPAPTARAHTFVTIKMPPLWMFGDPSATARLIAWRKRVGDTVHASETLCDIETESAVFSYSAQAGEEGQLVEILVEEGQEQISSGHPIAKLRKLKTVEHVPTEPPASEKQEEPPQTTQSSSSSSDEPHTTPSAMEQPKL